MLSFNYGWDAPIEVTKELAQRADMSFMSEDFVNDMRYGGKSRDSDAEGITWDYFVHEYVTLSWESDEFATPFMGAQFLSWVDFTIAELIFCEQRRSFGSYMYTLTIGDLHSWWGWIEHHRIISRLDFIPIEERSAWATLMFELNLNPEQAVDFLDAVHRYGFDRVAVYANIFTSGNRSVPDTTSDLLIDSIQNDVDPELLSSVMAV